MANNKTSNPADQSGYFGKPKGSLERSELTVGDHTEQPTTTPQGLLVTLDSNDKWEKLLLAHSLRSPATPEEFLDLKFENLNPILRSSFQTNELFMVISLNKPIKNHGSTNTTESKYDTGGLLGRFHNEIAIEGWPFVINVSPTETLDNFSNILIFKYCRESLVDRVKDTRLWTNAGDFNDTDGTGLGNISNWLTDYFQKAIDKSKHDFEVSERRKYQGFVDKVTDANWNGILALNTDINVMDLPKQLQGLLGGMDLSRFKSHHFGVDSVPVISANGDPSIHPTNSLFGLIDYEHSDPEPIEGNAVDSDYDYKVLQLSVLFENSKIRHFQSQSELMVNKLFGTKVEAKANNNRLVIDGTYENHNGVPVYIFDQTGNNMILLDNPVLTEVGILKVAFNTLIPDDREDGSKIQTRFSIWGYMNFAEIKGSDIFSFGSDSDSPFQRGLSFSNLAIDLAFDLGPDASKPANRSFMFDAAHIAFDLAQSTVRSGSLYTEFPLTLVGLIRGDDTNTLTRQGFLEIDVPNIPSGISISGDWYGLVFDVNVGASGTAAEVTGAKSALVTAWAAGQNGDATIGVKLPGVKTLNDLTRYVGYGD